METKVREHTLVTNGKSVISIAVQKYQAPRIIHLWQIEKPLTTKLVTCLPLFYSRSNKGKKA